MDLDRRIIEVTRENQGLPKNYGLEGLNFIGIRLAHYIKFDKPNILLKWVTTKKLLTADDINLNLLKKLEKNRTS